MQAFYQCPMEDVYSSGRKASFGMMPPISRLCLRSCRVSGFHDHTSMQLARKYNGLLENLYTVTHFNCTSVSNCITNQKGRGSLGKMLIGTCYYMEPTILALFTILNTKTSKGFSQSFPMQLYKEQRDVYIFFY